MLTKVVGLQSRVIKKPLKVGDDILMVKDPCGKHTGQKHSDKNAISLWCNDEFLGYISKDLNQNKFTKATIVNLREKDDSEFSKKYHPDTLYTSIEIECEGDFQITTDEGRTYETEGKQYESITSFLKNYPSDPEHLITWAIDLVQTTLKGMSASDVWALLKREKSLVDVYKGGLNKLALEGTEMHNKIEEFLLAHKKQSESLNKESTFSIEEKFTQSYATLPNNVKSFFLSLGVFKVVSVEKRYYSDDLKIACTGDAVLEVKGKDGEWKRIAFDWKSSKNVQMKHKVQSGFLGHCADCDLASVVCFGAQNKRRYSVSWVDIPPAINIIKALKGIKKEESNLTYKK